MVLNSYSHSLDSLKCYILSLYKMNQYRGKSVKRLSVLCSMSQWMSTISSWDAFKAGEKILPVKLLPIVLFVVCLTH